MDRKEGVECSSGPKVYHCNCRCEESRFLSGRRSDLEKFEKYHQGGYVARHTTSCVQRTSGSGLVVAMGRGFGRDPFNIQNSSQVLRGVRWFYI